MEIFGVIDNLDNDRILVKRILLNIGPFIYNILGDKVSNNIAVFFLCKNTSLYGAEGGSGDICIQCNAMHFIMILFCWYDGDYLKKKS